MDFSCPHRLNAGNIVLIKQSYCSWINVSFRVDILSTSWKGDNKLNWKYTKNEYTREESLWEFLLLLTEHTTIIEICRHCKKNRWTTKREIFDQRPNNPWIEMLIDDILLVSVVPPPAMMMIIVVPEMCEILRDRIYIAITNRWQNQHLTWP